MDSEKAKEKAKNLYEEVQGGFNEVISRIRELIKEGSARKLIIKDKEGKVLFQTQLAMGVGGAALIGAMAPVISAIGMFAMFLNDVTILVEKDPDAEDDEYSVDADVIEINEDEEDESADEEAKASEEEEKEEKTVGKKKK
ncbi:DUF4342 domain-containing protein [Balneola sp. MJW-20]|uniref:DUF4342 domain-containing protein n=1 Tax=Gracilimonas aurantiaca TaxID=3234185 RepID=UPI00346527BF